MLPPGSFPRHARGSRAPLGAALAPVPVALALAIGSSAGHAHEGPPVADAAARLAADGNGAGDGPILGPGGQWTPSTPAGYETVSEVVRPAAAETLAPQLGGRWSDVYGWPLVAVHAALLPNGRVIAWDATPDDADEDPHTTDNYTTRTTLWDPATNVHVQTYNDTDTDLFCAGSAHLWDGRLLFAGGDGGRRGSNAPLSNTNVYDWHTNTWRREADMAAPRWYASVAALGNGEMLTLEGSYSPDPVAEVFRTDRTWRPLDIDDVFDEGDYQWIAQVPDGSVMSFGPENLVASIDTDGGGAIEVLSTRDDVELRDYGSYAMYDPGRILVTGGGIGQTSAVTIDTGTGQVTDAGDMLFARRQHNLTILADGSVLVTGGNDDGEEYYSATGGVYTPELWNPDTGRFTALNDTAADRQYHSIALLLPDGTVLSAGGGLCGECYRLGYEERNADVFSPPYLFDANGEAAVRPTLANVPPEADYGETVALVTDAAGVSKAHLIKLGSPTHSENQDQRLVPLEHRASAGRLELVMPRARDAAPPGHYLLFVVDGAGVPSTGAMLKLGQPLVRAGEDVVSTLEPGATDRYLFTANGALELVVSGDAPLELVVSRDRPADGAGDAAGGTAVACEASAPGLAVQRCTVGDAGGGDARWYADVTGATRTDYRLASTGAPAADGVGEIAPAPDAGPRDDGSLADAGGIGTVRTGAGFALLPPLGLALLARRRRTRGR